mgnify:FL=1
MGKVIKMTKEKALEGLDELLLEIQTVIQTKTFFDSEYECNMVIREVYSAFITKILTLLKIILTDRKDENIEKIATLKFNSLENLKIIERILENIRQYIKKDYISLESKSDIKLESTFDLIFENFHKVVRKLKNRYNNRNTINIEDEYDVQDLLFAILQMFFRDIRKEEWTPSYAGNSSRVDFLLKVEKVVIEVKKTRKGMKDKDLGEQLIIDISKYKVHPDCQREICFVYDPEGRIINPEGIIKDLEEDNKGFVKIYINP